MTLLTFETTHDALRAERLGLEGGLAVQVVPAPAAIGARCGLALECLPEDMAALTVVLNAESVRYGVYVRSDAV